MKVNICPLCGERLFWTSYGFPCCVSCHKDKVGRARKFITIRILAALDMTCAEATKKEWMQYTFFYTTVKGEAVLLMSQGKNGGYHPWRKLNLSWEEAESLFLSEHHLAYLRVNGQLGWWIDRIGAIGNFEVFDTPCFYFKQGNETLVFCNDFEEVDEMNEKGYSSVCAYKDKYLTKLNFFLLVNKLGKFTKIVHNRIPEFNSKCNSSYKNCMKGRPRSWKYDEIMERAVAFLLENKQASFGEIAKGLHIHKGLVSELMDELVSLGKIAYTKGHYKTRSTYRVIRRLEINHDLSKVYQTIQFISA